jgi:hypothetical protein
MLATIDLATGAQRWEVPLGTMPELAQYPEPSRWGSLNLGGSIVTAGGLVFIGDAILLQALPRTLGGLKVGRNDPCPCGSGDQFKRCHLRTVVQAHGTVGLDRLQSAFQVW